MAKIKLPPVPVKDIHFDEKGNLHIKALVDTVYFPRQDAFVGGEFREVHYKSSDGAPVFIRLEGGEIIVEKFINGLIDPKTNYYVGGEMEVICKIALV